MAMHAEYVTVQLVENGWVMQVVCAGCQISLVTKTIEEISGFLRGMEWQTPRPLNYNEASNAGAVPMSVPTVLGNGR